MRRNSIGSRQQRLLAAIDEVLHYLWDPIGVSGVPQARSEYHDYVLRVFAILERGGDVPELASLLVDIETGLMGLPAGEVAARDAAAVLVDWRDSLADGSAESPIGRRG